MTEQTASPSSDSSADSEPDSGSKPAPYTQSDTASGQVLGCLNEKHPVKLSINGQQQIFDLTPWTTLLDLLREGMGLTGTKKGCDHGQCGACTVLVEGKRINACLTLAVMMDGAEITTIEGLAQGEALHPIQAAFIEHDAFQCGYCTPGQICSALGLLQEQAGKQLSDHELREQMSGNLCRCGAYPNILDAVREVMQGSKTAPQVHQEAV